MRRKGGRWGREGESSGEKEAKRQENELKGTCCVRYKQKKICAHLTKTLKLLFDAAINEYDSQFEMAKNENNNFFSFLFLFFSIKAKSDVEYYGQLDYYLGFPL